MNNFIEWETLEFKKNSGKEKVKCPVCEAQKHRKGDTPIQINHNEGYGKCFRCESLTFKEDKKDFIKKDFKLPTQNWRNFTELSEKVVKWFEKERKINQNTLVDLGVTQENYYQPKRNKKVDNIVFNYFEKDKVVNKKYRDSLKNFTQSAGTKSIFYNINSVINEKEAYIVEGEMDVLALHQIGIKNVISVPNGANDNDDYWENSKEYLKNIEKFIIAVDRDEKGNDLKEKIAQRLGRFKCEFIEWKNKDANDDLKEGVLNETVKKRKRFPVSGTFKTSDLKSGILDLYNNGLPRTIKPLNYYYNEFSSKFSVMRGQVTVGTGIPSHGKSNFTDWLVLNLINDYNLKGSWFSPEHSPMALYHTNLMEKVLGVNFWNHLDYNTREKVRSNDLSNVDTSNLIPRVSEKDIDAYCEWADERIYLTGAEGDTLPTWDWLLEKFKEQMYSFGVDIFVIDAFNKVLLPKGNKLDAINEVLTKLTHFAQSNNVIVFLVAHPTKMQKNQETGLYSVPTLYDVSGSADFRNQTHNGYSIYRTWETETEEASTDFYNMKTKMNFQGEIGAKVSFNYSTVNGRYYEKGTEEPLFSLINYKKEESKEYIKKELPKPSVSDAFGIDEDDVPF